MEINVFHLCKYGMRLRPYDKGCWLSGALEKVEVVE